MNFRMRWYDAVTGRWLSKDPIGLNGGINLYVFCENVPSCFIDPIGFSRVVISSVGGEKNELNNPSLDTFKKTIQNMRDKSIQELVIYDHGFVNVMSIDGNDDGMQLDAECNVRFDDDNSLVADLLGPKMASGGSVVLSGCFTAYEGILNPSGNNISKSLSVQLPNVSVTGNRGAAFGNKIGPTYNWGIRRTYIGGKKQ